MFRLRYYQQEMIDKVIVAIKEGYKRIMIVLPTGGGKTAIASELVKRSFDKRRSSIFMCHRQELITQTSNTYGKNGIVPAFIKSGVQPDYSNPMQIASVNTLVRRLDKYNVPDILFVDECHHAKANQWHQIFDWAKDSFIIGMTATPCRLDGKPLNDMFDTMIEVTDVKTLINDGYLVPYLYYAPSVIDTSGLKTAGGDYTRKSLEEADFTKTIVGDNIAHYKKIAMGKRNVVFAISRKHGRMICERYNKEGIPCEFVDGETPNEERKAILKRFADGETKVLVNVDLFGEGFDLPAIEVVSLLRPTQSLSLYLQQVGRALRTCPEIGKKYAIILDHVNNYKVHGLPDDKRKWALDAPVQDKKRECEKSELSIRRCPMCFYAHKPALKCPHCGYVYEVDNKTIKEIDGKLVLVGTEEYNDALTDAIKNAESLEQFVEIEKEKGYKFGWAEVAYSRKTGINLKSSLNGYEKIAKARGYTSRWAWIQWKIRRKR